MIVTLDYESELPLYSQLYDEIVRGIAEGSVTPGDSLPSVRSLAGDLSINLHTVNKTYHLLKQEGYVQIHRQKGAVVQPHGSAKATPEFLGRMERQLRSLAAEAVCRNLDEEQFVAQCRSIYRELKGGSTT